MYTKYICENNGGDIINKKETIKRKKCIIDIETTGFDPWTGRIVCIGVMDIDSKKIEVFYDNHEESFLVQFLYYFQKMEFREIIGFNIGFDIRWIIGRALFYNIPSANAFYMAKSTDLMHLLKGSRRFFNFNKAGTLDQWSRFLLGKGKLLKSGSIPALYREGKIDEILAYNKNDVEITFELWLRITTVLGGVNHGAK